MCINRPNPPAQPLFMGEVVQSYSPFQDLEYTSFVVQGNATPLQGGNLLKIWGNSWKKIYKSYNVTPDTVLEFEFSSNQQEAKINGIGFILNGQTYFWQIFGTQPYGIQDYHNYSGTGFKSYSIPIGQTFTGQISQMIFLADEDSHVGQNVSYRNPKLRESTKTVGSGYWQGTQRNMATTPYGNISAISCHNCYKKTSNASASVSATLQKIHKAQSKGADLIELDILEYNGIIRVDHGDKPNGNGAPLDDILLDSGLKNGNQVLFIEIKEKVFSSLFVNDLLTMLDFRGYGSNGRPIVIRTFNSKRQHLVNLVTLLNGQFSYMKPYIKLNVLFGASEANNINQLQTKILNAKNSGFHGVEFAYNSKNIYSFISYAKSLNLGISIYTIPTLFGEVYIAALREDVDAITVDYPIDKARSVVTDDTGLILAQWYKQQVSGNTIYYKRNSSASFSLAINGISDIPNDGKPYVETVGTGEGLFGTSLVFNKTERDRVKFYDADNDLNKGYFLATVINFDSLSLAENETNSLVAKTDRGGFGLELHNPPGSAQTVLRFGVNVGSAYHYASYPASNFNNTDSYFIVGAYDGSGQVHMWVNNTHVAQNGLYLTGGVNQNNSPVVVGADPQGVQNQRFYSSAKISFIYIQKWEDH